MYYSPFLLAIFWFAIAIHTADIARGWQKKLHDLRGGGGQGVWAEGSCWVNDAKEGYRFHFVMTVAFLALGYGQIAHELGLV